MSVLTNNDSIDDENASSVGKNDRNDLKLLVGIKTM